MNDANDITGYNTLDILSEANHFNQWMFETIKDYVKGSVIEIGSGIGNISEYILKNFDEVFLTDYDLKYCDLLTKKFGSHKNLKGVAQMDLVDPDFDTKYSSLFNSFDTLIVLNVIEHIKDDSLAIQNCKKLLRHNANLIVLVPAYQWLYNRLDTNLGHFKRYSRAGLRDVVKKNFEIVRVFNFNIGAVPGWFFSGRILRKETIPSGQVSLVNKIVPVLKMADKIVGNKVGLSVIAVGRNNDNLAV